MQKSLKLSTTGDAEKAYTIRPSRWYILLKTIFPITLGVLIIVLSEVAQVPYAMLIAGVPFLYAAYRGLYFAVLRYEISQHQIKYYRGVLNYKTDFLEMYRIKDFAVDEPLLLRMFGVMHFTMATSDKTHPTFRMEGIPSSNIPEVVRQLVERARSDKRVYEID